METLYIILFITLISIYTIGESRKAKADARTTALFVAVFYILSCLLAKQSWTMALMYLLLGTILAIVWSYWVQKGILAFHKEDAYYMPYWLPIWIAQSILTLQLFISYFHNYAPSDFDDE